MDTYTLTIRREKWPEVVIRGLDSEAVTIIRRLLAEGYTRYKKWYGDPHVTFTVGRTTYTVFVGSGYDLEIRKLS